MPISISFIRLSSSLIAPRAPDFPLKRFLFFSKYSSIPAQDFLTHLQKHQSHVEKNLDTVKSNLNSQCIAQCWNSVLLKSLNWASDSSFGLLFTSHTDTLRTCIAKLRLGVRRWDYGFYELRCMPDTVLYNVVIRLLVAKGRLDELMRLLKEIPLCDLTPDMVTYGAVIKGLCDAGDLEAALGLVKVMKGHGCVPNYVIYSTILDGICMHGSLKLALEFLDGMEKVEEKEKDEGRPNVVTYTTMIKGFIDKGMPSEARIILDRTYDSELKPNRVTFVTLIDGLVKEGKVEEAWKVVDTFGGDGVRTDELYNVLVLSLFRAERHTESEEVFRTMLARGLKPSGLTASSIIRGVVLEERVLDGYFLFQEIEKLGSLVSIDHDVYSSLLACLCQENHLAEAESLVNIMVERRVHLEPSQFEHLANFRSFLN
ncbi:hypothetical protein SASPL_153445 [Salvia splendens]|uniref:Leucine-rich PPR motif-containing protein, mitochondrial n=1 Tax=Salvia splendens TaxID=180675 RepID=A0A8X8Z1W6_SALSN|nr:hypothetical protein SASPL_153445 [Salvia splendens]